MSESLKYVGLDVHKDTIAVAVAEEGQRSEVREHGDIANTPAAMTKLLAKLGGPGVDLHICYEAGPCGYGIQRQVASGLIETKESGLGFPAHRLHARVQNAHRYQHRRHGIGQNAA